MADSLDDVLAEAEQLNLLRIIPRTRPRSADQRVAETFEAINAFIDEHSRVPHISADADEHVLALRLEAILSNPERFRRAGLFTLDDPHGLLSAPPAGNDQGDDLPPNSIDDILAGDESGLLDPGPTSIFDIQHVEPVFTARRMPETIAQARTCRDFWRYEAAFRELVEDINAGRVETARFKFGSQIEVGHQFIVRGMLCLVDLIVAEDDASGENNPRMRVVFSNGTESNMLKLSLARALYKDESGRRVIPSSEDTFSGNGSLKPTAPLTGRVYIVRSLAQHPLLAEYGALFKVGFTTGRVEDRLANAEKDPAFLEGPVRLVRVFDCYGMNPNRLEHLLHAFLAERRLSLTLKSQDGRTYNPREWFAVTEHTIVDSVQHLLDGTINKVRLDPVSGQLRRRG